MADTRNFDDRDGWITRREALLAPQRVPRTVSATFVARNAGVLEPDADIFDDNDDEADVVDDAVVPVRRQGRAGSATGRAVHATVRFGGVLSLNSAYDPWGLSRDKATCGF